jgi:predicted 2-oxoglutarate/Fe(II)-dependent dioxygenase YbiX/peroxiredoxin
MTDIPYPALLPHPGAGDPAPYFHQRTPANERFSFDTVGGRWLVLCFLGSATYQMAQGALVTVLGRRDLFDDEHLSFFGVTTDPTDESEKRLTNLYPGYRFFWDFDHRVTRLYGAAVPCWLVIDPTMRIHSRIPMREDGSDRAEVLHVLDSLPPPERHAGFDLQAPILVLPRVFEPEFCQHLISLYEANGGESSGFMREVNGRTVGINDPNHKVRKDFNFDDRDLISAVQARFLRRVVPEILKVHQYQVTRMERYLVACYAAEDGGHFRAHRDNTTSGTAHRRFAVSVNLNDDFDGGEVSFPEYGPRGFKAPVGGAVVFSCSLLHAVSTVTRGRRYAFLPFLYDDAAARIREANAAKVGEQGSNYRAAPVAAQSPA